MACFKLHLTSTTDKHRRFLTRRRIPDILQFFGDDASNSVFWGRIFACCTAVFTLLGTTLPARAADIAVTLPPLAGLVKMLDPDISSICLLKSGADPHDFQLQPRSIESLKQSRLLIRASRDDGGWPIPPSHSNTLDLWPDTSHGWLSPGQVQEALPRLSEALKKLYPDHTAAIEHHLSQATSKAALLGRQWQQALANTKSVIMQHPSWLPLMQDLNIPVLAVLESEHHGHESGPKQLEQALRSLNLHPDTWLVADLAHSSRPLDWLAQHANTPPMRVTFDPLGYCGESWDDLMTRNLEQINK